MHTSGITEARPVSFRDVPLVDMLRFWLWLSREVWVAPEFSSLTHEEKTALALLLRCRPGDHGAH